MRILLVQTSFMGDTVLSTPVIGALNELHSGAELWTLTRPESAELLRHDPRLSGRLIFDKRGREAGVFGLIGAARRIAAMDFARAYVLHRSARTALLMRLAGIPQTIAFRQSRLSFLYSECRPRAAAAHEVLRNLSLLDAELGGRAVNNELRLYAPVPESLSPYLSRFNLGGKQVVVLAPGSAWPTKRWHGEGYRAVAQHFTERGYLVVVLGTAAEKETCEAVCSEQRGINMAGQITISDVLHIIHGAKLVVCNDSLVLHIASAFRVPCVAVFCATSPRFGFGPWQEHAVVRERGGLPCKPCSRHGSSYCPLGTELCMRDVSSEEVVEAAEGLMAAYEARIASSGVGGFK